MYKCKASDLKHGSFFSADGGSTFWPVDEVTTRGRFSMVTARRPGQAMVQAIHVLPSHLKVDVR